MAEYESRERSYNNGLATVVGNYAMGLADAYNVLADAYVDRQVKIMSQAEPNAEFTARTTLIGLDQALETRVSVPKIVLTPLRPFVMGDANITLDMTVSASSEDSMALNFGMEVEGEGSVGVGPIAAKVRVKASLSVAKESKRRSDYTSTTHAELNMVQGDPPEGLLKIVDALNLSTTKALELNAELIEHQYLKLVAEANAVQEAAPAA